jgi:hypothetical protein
MRMRVFLFLEVETNDVETSQRVLERTQIGAERPTFLRFLIICSIFSCGFTVRSAIPRSSETSIKLYRLQVVPSRPNLINASDIASCTSVSLKTVKLQKVTGTLNKPIQFSNKKYF